MAEQDVQDGAATIARIGEACDALADLGFDSVAGALARSTRQRRGLLRRKVYPASIARELIDLAANAERLVRDLSPPGDAWYCRDCGAEFEEAEIEHDTCPRCGGKPRRDHCDDLRVLTGGSDAEDAARVATLGRLVRRVEHEVAARGESLVLEFDEQDGAPIAVAIEAPRDRPGVLVTTALHGESLDVVRALRRSA